MCTVICAYLTYITNHATTGTMSSFPSPREHTNEAALPPREYILSVPSTIPVKSNINNIIKAHYIKVI